MFSSGETKNLHSDQRMTFSNQTVSTVQSCMFYVEDKQAETAAKNHAVKEAEEGNLMDHLSGLFERFQKIRKSGRTEKKPGVVRPDRLKEVVHSCFSHITSLISGLEQRVEKCLFLTRVR